MSTFDSGRVSGFVLALFTIAKCDTVMTQQNECKNHKMMINAWASGPFFQTGVVVAIVSHPLATGEIAAFQLHL